MSVLCESVLFSSANNGLPIQGYIYVNPEVEHKAILQISHGMCEYVQRYRNLAEWLCDKGYIVCGNDHYGHGKSVKSSSDLGYLGNNPDNWSQLVDDVNQMTHEAMRKHPGLPVFLLGHSMGSFIARIYGARYGRDLKGLLISGTAGPNPLSGIAMKLCNFEEKSGGPKMRSTKINNIMFGKYNKQIPNATHEHDWLTRDTEIVEKYESDPLCKYVFTVSGFKCLINLLTRCNTKVVYKNTPKDLPIFIYSGSEDPVGGYTKGVRKVYDCYAKTHSKATLKLYPDGRHEMHNEINKDEVYCDILNFLDENV